MVGVWIEPVIAQLIMILFAIGSSLPAVFLTRPAVVIAGPALSSSNTPRHSSGKTGKPKRATVKSAAASPGRLARFGGLDSVPDRIGRHRHGDVTYANLAQ